MGLIRYLSQIRLLAIAAAGAFLTVALWSLGLWLAGAHVAMAWLLLPAWLMLGFGLLVYGFAIVETSALGQSLAPEFDASLIVNQHRNPAFRFCVLAATGASFWFGLGPPQSPVPGIVLGLLAVAWLPAGVALLALEGSVRRALDPRVVGGFAAAMGWRYPAMVLVLLIASTALVAAQSVALGSFFAHLGLLLAFFAVARWLGTQVFARRESLELGVYSESELLREHRERAEIDAWKRAFDRIHLACGSGRLDEAEAVLAQVLAEARRCESAQRWFFEELKENGHARLALRVVRRIADGAARAGNPAAVLDDCEWGCRMEPGFVLSDAAATLTMARAAAATGRYRLATALLAPFPAKFAGSAERGAAAMLEARICAEHIGDTRRARDRLAWLAERVPAIVESEEYVRVERLVSERLADPDSTDGGK